MEIATVEDVVEDIIRSQKHGNGESVQWSLTSDGWLEARCEDTFDPLVYEIDINDMRSPLLSCRWMRQLHEKTWFTLKVSRQFNDVLLAHFEERGS